MMPCGPRYDKLVQAGKIRHLGTSIGSNDDLHQTDASTKVNASVIQVVYNFADRIAGGRSTTSWALMFTSSSTARPVTRSLAALAAAIVGPQPYV